MFLPKISLVPNEYLEQQRFHLISIILHYVINTEAFNYKTNMHVMNERRGWWFWTKTYVHSKTNFVLHDSEIYSLSRVYSFRVSFLYVITFTNTCKQIKYALKYLKFLLTLYYNTETCILLLFYIHHNILGLLGQQDFASSVLRDRSCLGCNVQNS